MNDLSPQHGNPHESGRADEHRGPPQPKLCKNHTHPRKNQPEPSRPTATPARLLGKSGELQFSDPDAGVVGWAVIEEADPPWEIDSSQPFEGASGVARHSIRAAEIAGVLAAEFADNADRPVKPATGGSGSTPDPVVGTGSISGSTGGADRAAGHAGGAGSSFRSAGGAGSAFGPAGEADRACRVSG